MTDLLQITLPWFSRNLHPNARVHWTVKYKDNKSARIQARVISMAFEDNDFSGDLDLLVEVWTPTRHQYDADGILSSLKPSIDGIAEACKFDDSQIKRITVWKKGVDEKKKGYLTLSLRQLTD